MRTSIWKGSISFGLLNIPVTLHSAEQDKELHFSLLDRENLSHIRYKKINAQTGKEVPFHRIAKGYEFEKGRFVILTEADFRKANAKATQTIDIEDFAFIAEVDPLLFEKPYYLVPQKGSEKGYFLLREALARSQKVAIAKIVIRIKQHLAMIMPRGDYLILELLRFAHQVKEIHEADFLKDINKKIPLSVKELKMAEDLIKGMTHKWKPDKYKDTYYQDMMKFIKSKVHQRKGHLIKPSREEHISPTSNLVDLMPLLQKSLAAKKHQKKQILRKVQRHRKSV